MRLTKFVFFLLPFFYTGAALAQTADEIITKYIAFTGGERQWKTIKTIVTSGTYNYGGIGFPFTSYSKAPDMYKFVVPYKGKYFAQAFDGKQGWKIDAFKNETKKTILTGKPALAMANEADVALESPFIHYREKGHSASLEGEDTADSKLCYKVKLIRQSGDEETWFFDKENYAAVEKIAVSKNAELENSLLETYYTDYRKVGNISLPFKSVSKANGQTVLTITLSKAEVNLPLSDTRFKP